MHVGRGQNGRGGPLNLEKFYRDHRHLALPLHPLHQRVGQLRMLFIQQNQCRYQGRHIGDRTVCQHMKNVHADFLGEKFTFFPQPNQIHLGSRCRARKSMHLESDILKGGCKSRRVSARDPAGAGNITVVLAAQDLVLDYSGHLLDRRARRRKIRVSAQIPGNHLGIVVVPLVEQRVRQLDQAVTSLLVLPGLFIGDDQELQTRPVPRHRLQHLLKKRDRFNHFCIRLSHFTLSRNE